MKPNNDITMKTKHALCGLLSGLLLLAAGTAQTHAGLLVPAAPGAQLYVGNAGIPNVEKFTPGGVGSVFASSNLNQPRGLAFDSAGNLYASNSGNNAITKITSGGTTSLFASTGLNSPFGLAFDNAGNLFVANSIASGSIRKFSSSGTDLGVFASTGSNSPYDLAFDSAGNLYASYINTNTIGKFTPGGVGSLFASSGGSAPTGLAFDSAGNLFVANFSSNTIRQFSSSGTDLGIFADSSDGLSQPTFLAFGPVPEPGTALLLLGSGAMLLLRRRRRA